MTMVEDSRLRRAAAAPDPRTLVDIFHDTVAEHGDEPALDNGAVVLTYAEFAESAAELAHALGELGVSRGDKVGIRISSGTTDLYVAIMATLLSGAAYVPVDYDDPHERARTVFDQSAVAAVITNDLVITPRSRRNDASSAQRPNADDVGDPRPGDDAWVIFTSGSTGAPKGVAVTHRSAAAFVDAEARLFLQDRPLGPGDRVMAGLSVAFDASCEEMWLAWRYGACLVPAPRSLVRSGIDLGPWLVANDVTIVSTVPTLVSLWPPAALAQVRLLILGGEACPPELAARLVTPTREVWNTYGPTEATVVACGARLEGTGPVRIGLPLDGWDLAIVDGEGREVPAGEIGELVIGGVGLARYLDPAKDAEKYAPMPTLGWDRAYRSGDLVRDDGQGLLFNGRADDQVKIGGRRIELGELDAALLAVPGVNGAAAAVRRTSTGNAILVGYVTVEDSYDNAAALSQLRAELPAALVPRLAVVQDLPTRTSGKIDRDALPWPLTTAEDEGARLELSGVQAQVRDLWVDVLGTHAASVEDDFFDLGGRSLTAAQMVSLLRASYPEVTIADIYDHPTLAAMAAHLEEMAAPTGRLNRDVPPVPRKTQIAQIIGAWPVRTLAGLRWLTWVCLSANVFHNLGVSWLPNTSWWALAALWLVLITPIGRMLLAAGGARIILAGITPGSYPRGGRIHGRLWLAERLADETGAANLSGAALMRWYARLLGCTVAKDVDLHAIPPVTGMLRLGQGCSVEPEVDLVGYWMDGGRVHVGEVVIGARARVGARSTLNAGTVIEDDAEVAAGSATFGRIPAGEFWSGAPAQHIGPARGPWQDARPLNKPAWAGAYAATAVLISALPGLAAAATAALAWWALGPQLQRSSGPASALLTITPWLLPATLVAGLLLSLAIWALARACALGLLPGHYPVQGRQAWKAWTIVRVLDEARNWLFPLYSSTLTPYWLRALGARIGPDVEASTVLMIPTLTAVDEGAFLADDTLIGGYELGGGWLRIERVKVGKHAFVGNSGMAAPGRKVPKKGLVAVLSAAPQRSQAKTGTSWIGSPPAQLRRPTVRADRSRTRRPARKLRVYRALMETARILPTALAQLLAAVVVAVLLQSLIGLGWVMTALLCGLVMVAAGAVAAGLASGAKWLLVGRIRTGDHPLWSSFVWRNELADTFVEVIAAPWFARAAIGTPALNLWLRSMGARIGRGVWCETYWLPEADLIDLREGATVNRGCVVQTHLFHDRVLSLDTVTLRAGSTLGPNGVILPAATIGRHATVGPVSLVMRGESVPDQSRWIGNPIGPWSEATTEPA